MLLNISTLVHYLKEHIRVLYFMYGAHSKDSFLTFVINIQLCWTKLTETKTFILTEQIYNNMVLKLEFNKPCSDMLASSSSSWCQRCKTYFPRHSNSGRMRRDPSA